MSRLLWLDYRAALRERKVLLAVGMYGYALLGLPALLSKPPPHMIVAVEGWFGTLDPFALFLYMWTDIAMNKLLTILAVVLAGGIVTRERDLHILPVLWSKPLSPARYFVMRAVSACGVMATLYVGAHLVGLAWFGVMVEGFRPFTYLASMTLHLGAVLFAAAFAATASVLIPRRGLAMLVVLLVLFTLVGASFLGFYNPAWAGISLLNPFTLGVQALAHLDDLRVVHVLAPLSALVALIVFTLAVGAYAVRRLEA